MYKLTAESRFVILNRRQTSHQKSEKGYPKFFENTKRLYFNRRLR